MMHDNNKYDGVRHALAGWLLAASLSAYAVEVVSPVTAGGANSRLAKPAEPAGATGGDEVIGKLEFKDAALMDVIRALADMSGLNIVATEEAAKKKVTVFLQNITVKDALDTISKNSGLWYRQDKSGKTFRIMTTDEYQKDMVVYREETTRIFNLLHPNPIIVATAIRDIFPNRVQMTLGVEDTTTISGTGTGGTTGGATTNTNTALRQATTRQGNRAGNRTNAAGGGNQVMPEQMVTESLTPDQLAKLETVTKTGGVVSSEELSKISGSEQPIYLTLNREHNLIIVRTSDNAAIKDIERLIKDMDKPTPQVLLELKILSVDVGDGYKQAFDMDLMPNSNAVRGPLTTQDRNPLFNEAEHTVSDTTTTTIGSGDNKRTITDTSSGKYTLGVRNILGLGNFALEGGTFVYQFMNDKIRARIQLLEEKHHVKTLSSPIVLASNNKPARVFVGQEQVITTGFNAVGGTVTGTTVTSPAIIPVTEVRNIGNTLQIMPKINADKSVTLLIQQDSSSVITKGSSIPIPVGGVTQYFDVDTVKTSNMQGTVVAKDGLTVAIGGLIDSSTSSSVQKVPFLGDIPLFGELFQRKVESTSKRELMLLITPHIITTANEGEDVSRDVMEPISSQEW